MKETEL